MSESCPRCITDEDAMKTQDEEKSAFSKRLLMASQSFQNGHFKVRLPSDLTGLEGKIADTFNAIVSLSDRRPRLGSPAALRISRTP
jgi:hypothetical protein